MESFFRRHLRATATVVALFLLAEACLGPDAAYGTGWAVAAVALQVAWLTVIVFFRRKRLRGPRRLRVAFGFGFPVLVLVSLMFPFLALLIGQWVPAWGSLGIAVALSLLLVGPVWPAQKAYLRSRKVI